MNDKTANNTIPRNSTKELFDYFNSMTPYFKFRMFIVIIVPTISFGIWCYNEIGSHIDTQIANANTNNPKIIALEGEILALKQKNVSMKNDVDPKIKDISKLKRQIESMDDEILALKQTNMSIKNDVVSKVRDISKLKRQIESMDDERIDLVRKTRLKASIQATDINELNFKIRNLNNQISSLKEQQGTTASKPSKPNTDTSDIRMEEPLHFKVKIYYIKSMRNEALQIKSQLNSFGVPSDLDELNRDKGEPNFVAYDFDTTSTNGINDKMASKALKISQKLGSTNYPVRKSIGKGNQITIYVRKQI